MSLLDWRDEFRIGIAEVDHEHQVLIGLINDLHAALGAKPSEYTSKTSTTSRATWRWH